MKKKYSSTIISVCLVALLSLTNFLTISASPGLFTENFFSTTYEDAVATTAIGWGSGSVHNPSPLTVLSMGQYLTDDPVRGLDTQGRKAYILTYDPVSSTNSNHILDISDPGSSSLMGQRDSFNKFITGTVDGDIFYGGRNATGGTATIAFYNVSDPYNYDAVGGVYLGSETVDGSVTDLEVQGHFLYAAVYQSAADDGLAIFDVEDPANRYRISGSSVFSELLGLDVVGQLAYLAVGTYGLYIVNVSNPYSVVTMGLVNTPGNATDVLVDGTIAYVADGMSGIQVVDVSNPSSPSIIGSCDTPGNAVKLALQENTLFVADQEGGLRLINVSDPTDPRASLGHGANVVYEVVMSGSILLVGDDSGVHLHRFGDGIATDLPLISEYSTYDAVDVAIQGDIAYMAAGTDGLVLVDVSDPVAPVLLDQIQHTTPCYYTSVAVQGHLVFAGDVGSADTGIYVFDATDPTNVEEIGYEDISYPYDIFLDGDLLYLADGTYGVYSFNTSTPSNPSVIDWSDDVGNCTSVWAQGHFVYASGIGAGGGYAIYDVTDLSTLNLIKYVSATADIDIEVDGDFLGIADGTMGTYLINVTDPWAPIYLDHYNPVGTNYSCGVALYGRYMVIAERLGGVHLIDATDPTNLQLVNSSTASGLDCRKITVHGDYAYVANTDSLLIFRIFRSCKDSYRSPRTAQSLTIDFTPFNITEATLTRQTTTPPGTSIEWFMSIDGGAHWESITPGATHAFVYNGSDLRWRAILTSINSDRTPSIESLTISYLEAIPPPNFLPIIIGVIVVLIIVLAILLLYFLWYRKRK